MPSDLLAAFCERLGEKRFRAVQLYRWIHQRGESDFERMSDLAKTLRGKLPPERPLVAFLTVTDARGLTTSSEHVELGE